ncbi:FGFR1 oncogene partner 2 homolog [Dermatophagoides pteronyssinus]|uniref:FGFR1 oncoprotein partner 2 n=2 Tax=Dermatophagoides pteronyssinus TaxID=6956 RepID=A0ABQ8JWY6_DERPT|nr:suppressor of IKBKE 1-like [Dermatophagoides pteronyssinus]KAH9427082.1 FGFR1 oncoprotein partner 2 [Dermatophagoides pteronyssinus]
MSMMPLIYKLKSMTKSLDKSKTDSDSLFQEIIDIRKEIEASIHWLAISPQQQQQLQQRQNIFIDDHQLIDQSSLVIQAIQRESPQVSKLRQRNYILKQQLQEYEFALELIMSKYRQLILMLLQTSNRCQQNILKTHQNQQRDRTKTNIITSTTRIQQLIETFNEKISPYNEEILLKQTEKLQQLQVEYKGLLELYRISKEFGSLKSNKQ